jgi:hypothetical protein
MQVQWGEFGISGQMFYAFKVMRPFLYLKVTIKLRFVGSYRHPGHPVMGGTTWHVFSNTEVSAPRTGGGT